MQTAILLKSHTYLKRVFIVLLVSLNLSNEMVKSSIVMATNKISLKEKLGLTIASTVL